MQHEPSEKWDRRFLELARHIAAWSKDPSTKVGAVITQGNRIISQGYNGFPQGVTDTPELYLNREEKYKRIIHAEMNAILFARGADLAGATLYTWPLPSCERCATMVIQSGISRHVSIRPKMEGMGVRWGESNSLAFELFHQAGVKVRLY